MRRNGNGNGNERPQRVVIHVTDDERSAVAPLVDAGESLWQSVAKLRAAHESDARAEGVEPLFMQWYEEMGVECRKSRVTVSQWCSVYERAGRELCGEYPEFGFAHFREFCIEARLGGTAVADVAAKWAETAAAYGGKPVPVDVIRAARNSAKKPTPHELYQKAVNDMRAAGERATRYANQCAMERTEREAQLLETAVAAVDDLQAAVCGDG